MKFLVDMPASPDLVPWLEERNHNAVHAQEIGLATAPDTIIMARAVAEKRVIITADLDFGYLLFRSEKDVPGVILFRGGNYSEEEMRELVERVLETLPGEVIQHSIIVVDKRRIRITHLPITVGRNEQSSK